MVISFFNVVIFAKWAHENGCPWEDYVISNTLDSGRIEFQRSYICKMGS